MMRWAVVLGCMLGLGVGLSPSLAAERVKLLFLGDNGHHRPAERFRQLQPVLAHRGIDIEYTDQVTSLQPQTLGRFAGLVIYANIDTITPEQEKALLDYVASGKGLIALHCASYCFRNSEKYIALVGAQFQRHGSGTFRTTIAASEHPLMRGFRGFESWDETYVHTKHNEQNRTVLEYRVEGQAKEPWTWVRTHGQGRVFYTAWGHDERTWAHPGFHNLVERGIRWAIGQEVSNVPPYVDRPEMVPLAKDAAPFEYVPAKVPFYAPNARWGTQHEPLPRMQKPLSPRESMKHYTHPADFELKLFVAEDKLGGKPLCMNWDERGRLWVALTQDYPNELQPEGQGRDRIVICEDLDNDGVADQVRLFADKLSIPTSLTFANGGVIVHQAPHTLFLKDTDGDGKADVRQILFTGWHTNDTHAGPSNLNYGLDNWLYGMVGYAGFDGTIGGVRHSFRTGFYRFKPDGSAMEFLRNTNNNSWGVGFSEDGLLFGSTANGCPSVYLPVPNRYYERVRGWSSTVLTNIAPDAKYHPITDKIRQVDWHGQFTAAAGSAIYTARTYPPEYWNRTQFVCDPTGHLTATFVLERHGSDVKARYGWNLAASDDEWVAPIAAEVGPDGHVWILDWYNFIVQHNPTPVGFKNGKGNAYETDLRDKKHGRIYRLVAKSAKPTAPLSLAGATPEKLVETLTHDNFFWRRHAQRLLVERGQLDVVPALIRLVNDRRIDAIGLNGGTLHALWTLHGLGALTAKHPEALAAAKMALRHPSAAVRRAAVQVLTGTELPQRAELLRDPDAHVRLAVLLSLADSPADATLVAALIEAAFRSENFNDRWIMDALTAAAAAHDAAFLRAIAYEKRPLPAQLQTTIGIVAEHFARGPNSQAVGELVVTLADAEPSNAALILAGLVKGTPRGREVKLPAVASEAMKKLLTRLPPASKAQVLLLVRSQAGPEFAALRAEVTQGLLAVVADERRPDNDRLEAVRECIAIAPKDVALLTRFLDRVTPQTPPALANGILEAVGSSRTPEVASLMLQRLGSWSPTVRATALRVLLGQSEYLPALLDAIDAGKVQLSELSLDQKQALVAHADAKIATRVKQMLARGGALPSPDRQKVIDQWLPITKLKGDAQQGKAVFLKHCSACHVHGSDGQKVGPELTGMAVHPKEELLTHILDPNRSVEGNFRVYSVAMKDGRLFNGLLASETKTSIELIDTQAKRITLLREDIDELTGSTKSLMPEGFEKQLTKEEFTHLLEFLTHRGKFLPLPLDKVANVVSTRGMFFDEESTIERIILPDWKPKTVQGVPFALIDPQGDRFANVVMLYGPNGTRAPKMPKSVQIPCNASAKAVHLLSGISGWGYPIGIKGSVSMIVRLHYADGTSEDHPLRNGEHFADYIRRIDVPDSTFAFAARSQQVRYLRITPKRSTPIERIELLKGSDGSAPLVLAVTVESPE